MAAAIPNSGPHLVDQVHVVNKSYLHPHLKKNVWLSTCLLGVSRGLWEVRILA